MVPADPVADAERLAVVARLELLDTPREPVFEEIARVVARLLGAAYGFVTIVDDERSFWKAAHGTDDDTRSNAVEESFCQYVIRSREALLVDDATAHPVTCDNPSIEGMGVRAWAGAPIMIDHQVVGSLCVVDVVPRKWTDTDREILHAFRDQVEREIQHRRAFQAEQSEHQANAQSLADLRAELVPAELPDVPGLDIAGWHHAAMDGRDVLGDFYDVFRIDEHRWGLALGDVCGHGAAAARLTALVRYTLRAAATHTSGPAEALDELDAGVRNDHIDPGRFVTISYLEVDTNDVRTIRRASAGHPPPLVRHPDGTVERLNGAHAGPIGLGPDTSFGDETVTLAPGATVLLYSDGATDARNAGGEPLGTEALEALVAAAPIGDASAVIQFIADEILKYSSDNLLDDVALFAVTF